MKHNSDINIEFIEKGSSSKNRVYHRLHIPTGPTNALSPIASGGADQQLERSSSVSNLNDSSTVPPSKTTTILLVSTNQPLNSAGLVPNYTCQICKAVLNNPSSFLEHLQGHTPPNKIESLLPLKSIDLTDEPDTQKPEPESQQPQQPAGQQQNQLIQLLNRKSRQYPCTRLARMLVRANHSSRITTHSIVFRCNLQKHYRRMYKRRQTIMRPLQMHRS